MTQSAESSSYNGSYASQLYVNALALEWAKTKATASQLDRYTLDRIMGQVVHPTSPHVVSLLAKQLTRPADEGPISFGSQTWHRYGLSLNQLEELRGLVPALIDQDNYVRAILDRLVSPTADPTKDAAAFEKSLAPVLTFVNQLSNSFNAIKANVAYQVLYAQVLQGKYDENTLHQFLAIPKYCNYSNYEFLEVQRKRHQNIISAGSYGAVSVIAAPSASEEEELVKHVLTRLFITRDTWKAFENVVNEDWLKNIFAVTKVRFGPTSDLDKYNSLLSGTSVDIIKREVTLKVSPYAPTYWPSAGKVTLSVEVKHVPKLIVKLFEINTLRYYRENESEIPSDISLDGLVPSEELQYEYNEPDHKAVFREYSFPSLDGRSGVFVLEFVGSGLSRRAVVYKGRLNAVERQTVAGHHVTIMNEKFEKVADAKLWMSGNLYTPDADGDIIVPYSTSGSSYRTAVIYAGADESSGSPPFADLFSFTHAGENYTFDAAFHVERESLVPFNKTSIVIKPRLILNGSISTPVSIMTEIFFTISTVDGDGVSSSKDVPIKFTDDAEYVFDFQVPDRLVQLSLALRAVVKTVTTSTKQNFNASKIYYLNGIDSTSGIEQTFLRYTKEQGYSLHFVGKTGDAIPRREITVVLTPTFFRDSVSYNSLTTDDKGIIVLGQLRDYASVNANGIDFQLSPINPMRAATLHLKTGQALQVAVTDFDFPGNVIKPEFVSLVSYHSDNNSVLSDFAHLVKLERGLLTAPRGLMAGTYRLVLKRSAEVITIIVQAAQSHSGFLFGAEYILEKSPFSMPLQIAAITPEEDQQAFKIELVNSTDSTRVHVFASEYLPEYDASDLCSAVARPGVARVTPAYLKEAQYTSRELSEEQRYVLDRRYAPARQGNTLTPPSLLLNPWAVDSTKTSLKNAAGGGSYGSSLPCASMAMAPAPISSYRGGRSGSSNNQRNYDFKFYPCKALYNLRADAQGVVSIKRSQLGGTPNAPLYLRIAVVDEHEMVIRDHALQATAEPEPAVAVKDLRLKPARALKPTEHFTEQKHITLLQASGKFVAEDLSTSKIEILDSLQKVYTFFTTVSPDANIKNWSWLLKWESLSASEREEKYHEYASHELHVFLYFKDRAFFDTKIAPFLRNKLQKTFIDEWLLISDPAFFVKYAAPGLFSTLNAAEKALLVHRLPEADAAALAKSMQDLSTAIAFSKSDRNRFNHLFKTILGSSSLDTESDGYVPAEESDEEMLADEVLAPVVMSSYARSSSRSAMREESFGGGGYPSPAPPPMASAAPPMAMMSFAAAPSRKMDMMMDMEMESEAPKSKKKEKASAAPRRMAAKRSEQVQLYQAPEKTKKYAESQYYKQADPKRSNTLIAMNAFWSDFAVHRGSKTTPAFLSKNFIYATGSFAEMVLALAVLDLPLVRPSQNHPTELTEGGGMILTAAGPVIVFHKDIKQSEVEKRQVLVVQNFFDPEDRHATINGEYGEKYIEEEFLNRKVYGCNYIISNIGSSPQRVEVLLQVPVGAIPVLNGSVTKSVYMDVSSYTTQSGEFHFYFPRTGDYPIFPVHAARDEKAIAWAQVQLPAAANGCLHVVDKLSKHDKKSWNSYISQLAPSEEVLDYLKNEDIFTVELERIAWRMKEADFFNKAVAILRSRATFNKRIWGYAVLHKDKKGITELLASDRERLKRLAGVNAEFDAFPGLTTNAWAIRDSQHYEFWPLINARTHKLGKDRTILNDGFKAAYEQFLNALVYRSTLTRSDLLIACYYMLLQDRVEEAVKLFERAQKAKLEDGACPETTALQVDYLAAYLDFFNEKPTVAREICAKHIAHPILRWRRMFQEIKNQIDEFDTGVRPEDMVDPDDRNARMGKAAHHDPSLEIETVPGKIIITHHSISSATLSFYKMDIELLFSAADYKPNELGKFAYVKPNLSFTVKLDPKDTETAVEVPAALNNCNVMIEVSSGARSKVVPYFSHSLLVKLSQSYGQVQVHDRNTGRSLARVYAKVFSRSKNGDNRFYKDGYTDIRGAFDYASLSTDEMDNVAEFSILVMSPNNGTRILQASPPSR